MDTPTITVRISANIINGQLGGPDPLVEIVAIETIVNSTPAINAAVRDFARRYGQDVELSKIKVQQA